MVYEDRSLDSTHNSDRCSLFIRICDLVEVWRGENFNASIGWQLRLHEGRGPTDRSTVRQRVETVDAVRVTLSDTENEVDPGRQVDGNVVGLERL